MSRKPPVEGSPNEVLPGLRRRIGQYARYHAAIKIGKTNDPETRWGRAYSRTGRPRMAVDGRHGRCPVRGLLRMTADGLVRTFNPTVFGSSLLPLSSPG